MVCASFPGVSSARGGLDPRLMDAIPSGIEVVHFVPDV